ncbi:endonuclease V isoform X20 [Pan paniscus]|uniref:endonuclease V isoform X20 n=1 Tax=Pan paniscus TaxID=9597 RepID=UPI003005CFFF
MALEAAGGPPEETLSLWKREQARLKAHVVDRDTEAWQRDPAFSGLQRVGGVDVSFVKGDSVRACASLVVLTFPELEVLLVDGNGVLHHRGFGVACHLGVLTDLPCVGVAKKLLQVDGLENNALHKEKIRLLQTRGDSFPLLGDSGTVLGMALRSHDRSTRPLYISVGHRMSLEAAVRLTCCCCRFRIPEPVRQEPEGAEASGMPQTRLWRVLSTLLNVVVRAHVLVSFLIERGGESTRPRLVPDRTRW